MFPHGLRRSAVAGYVSISRCITLAVLVFVIGCVGLALISWIGTKVRNRFVVCCFDDRPSCSIMVAPEKGERTVPIEQMKVAVSKRVPDAEWLTYASLRADGWRLVEIRYHRDTIPVVRPTIEYFLRRGYKLRFPKCMELHIDLGHIRGGKLNEVTDLLKSTSRVRAVQSSKSQIADLVVTVDSTWEDTDEIFRILKGSGVSPRLSWTESQWNCGSMEEPKEEPTQ